MWFENQEGLSHLSMLERVFEGAAMGPLTLSVMFILILEWILVSQAELVEHLPEKGINRCSSWLSNSSLPCLWIQKLWQEKNKIIFSASF